MTVGYSGGFSSCCAIWFYRHLKYPSLTVCKMTSWYLYFSVCFGHDPEKSICGPAVPDDGGSDIHPAKSTGKTRAVWPAERGCVGIACRLVNAEMLPLLQHFSPLLHGNRAIGQKKVTSHVPRYLSDLHDSQKDSWGLLWSLQKQGEIGCALK